MGEVRLRGIGIDIGGTAVKAGRLGPAQELELHLERPTPAREGPDALLEVLLPLLEELEAALPQSECPLPLGVGCAGLIEPTTGLVRTSPNLPGWRDVPLADLLGSAAGRPVVVLNDANAFTLAESRLGAGRSARTVIGLTLGTGVGGGLLLDGRLWTGQNGFAGELGHMPLVADGPPCLCGARGCLEALVGTPAIIRRYGEITGRVEAALTPRLLAARAGQGDGAALETFRETGRLLGLALGGLTHLLDPNLFIVGGGISGASDLILPATRGALAGSVMLPAALVPDVRPAALGNSAGWIGAALAAIERAGT
jgi:glucokinase